MAKLRIVGTAGNDTIDLTGRERELGTRFDGFEVFAGAGADRVIGSALHDVLRGEAGDDVLEGGKGNDVLLGGIGNDTLDGGAGTDTASYAGEAGFVRVDLAAGTGAVTRFVPGFPSVVPVVETDTLASIENATAGDGGSVLIGNALNNVLTGGRGADTLIGAGGNDTLIGGEGVDTASYAGETRFVDVNLSTGTGKVISAANLVVEQDTLSGIENAVAGSGGSRLAGDGADNRLTGGAGADELRGEAGNDTLIGGAGDDTLIGGENDDFFFGGAGRDHVYGGEGIDTVSYAGQDGFLNFRFSPTYFDNASLTIGGVVIESDRIIAVENLTTGDGGSEVEGSIDDNALTGGAGRDEFYAGDGNDTLFGGRGNDVLDGGAGVDTASYAGESKFVYVNLAGQFARIDPNPDNPELEEVDTLLDIENAIAGDAGSFMDGTVGDNALTGGAGEDTLRGLDGADTLIGGGGNDILQAGRGEDVLVGGNGADFLDGGEDLNTLTGGQGADTFYYNMQWAGTQVVTDFDTASPEHDTMQIEYFRIMTDLADGATAADAISQGYLVFVQYGTAGQGDFGTVVMVDRNGGLPLAEDMTTLFVLEGVEREALQAHHFAL
jgi:Ca2+-binding RTX toxin-like protein